jgi:PhnB protein
MKIPDGYQAVMPYLIVKDAAAFIEFTKKVFNAELTLHILNDENLVRHAEIKINGSVIMFADCTEMFKPRGATLMVYVENADESYKKAIEEGSEIIRELSDQEYGRSGGVTDPFGITWWITSVI